MLCRAAARVGRRLGALPLDEGPPTGQIRENENAATSPFQQAVRTGNVTEVLVDANVAFGVAPYHVPARPQKIRDAMLVN